MKGLLIAINSPWKLLNELLMLLIKPFVLVYLYICGVSVGKGAKFYGIPLIYRHRGSAIKIGKNFECRSWWFSNPIGLNHPTILCTWAKGAEIRIGDDVGISGGSIVAAKGVSIGNGTLVGANSVIVDNNFHPLKSKLRRYEKKGVGVKRVEIGNNVFIGMNTLILKGVRIADDSVIPAGEVRR